MQSRKLPAPRLPEVAMMVLGNDRFPTIGAAVEEGRGVRMTILP